MKVLRLSVGSEISCLYKTNAGRTHSLGSPENTLETQNRLPCSLLKNSAPGRLETWLALFQSMRPDGLDVVNSVDGVEQQVGDTEAKNMQI